MSEQAVGNAQRGRAVAITAAASLVLAGVPSAALAIGALDGAVSFSREDKFTALTPASVDLRIARLIDARGDGNARLMRFTPAGA